MQDTQEIEIGLGAETRQRVVAHLKRVLADEVVLYVKTRNFHWNVEGADFYELHKFFEAQYEQLDEVMDEVAERIRALGAYAPGSLAEFVRHAKLPEVPGGGSTEERMEALLLRDHQALIRVLRELVDEVGRLGDAGTQDFLTGLLEQHEKMAWMLRSQLRR